MAYLAVAELKFPQSELSGYKRRLVKDESLELEATPCVGEGSSKSSGVGIAARPGITCAPLSTKACGFDVPSSPRVTVSLVEGCFRGGFLIICVYFPTGGDMCRKA